MKNISRIIFTLFALFTTSIVNAQVIYGHCIIQNMTLDELTCYGPTDISNTLVKGKLTVTGSINMNKVDVGSIEVKGPLETNNSIIRGKVIAYGTLIASNTQFMSEIYAATPLIKLTNSTVSSDINIRSEQQQPIVEMNDHAMIFGNLSFTQQEGLVKMSNDSEIKGTISNGKKAEPKVEKENKASTPEPDNKESKSTNNANSANQAKNN